MRRETLKARWVAVLVATGLALYVCWLMLLPFLAVLEWAIVLVIVFYPVHRRLAKKLRRPGLTALCSSLLVIVVVLVPLGFLIATLARELTGAAQNLPHEMSPFLEGQSPVSAKLLSWLEQHFNLGRAEMETFVIAKMRDVAGSLLSQSLGVIGNLLSGILQAIFVVFTMYYLFRDGEHIVSALPDALPLRRSESEAILKRTVEVIGASVYGVVTIATIQGILGGLAFWILGVPSPILWGVFLGFVCLIPIAGSFLVWLPAALYLGLTGHWTKALILVLWGTFVISLIDNFLRPRFIKQYTRLHELLVFFSVLGGMKLFGLLGIVLGPVVLAITIGLLQTFRMRAATERESLP